MARRGGCQSCSSFVDVDLGLTSDSEVDDQNPFLLPSRSFSAPYLLAWYVTVDFVTILRIDSFFFFLWSYISKPSETRASIEIIYRPKCQNIESNYHSASLNCQTIWLMLKSNPMRITSIVFYYCYGWNIHCYYYYYHYYYLHSLMHFSQDIVLNKIHIAVVVKEFGIDPKIDILRYSRAEPPAGGYGNLLVMKEIILIC